MAMPPWLFRLTPSLREDTSLVYAVFQQPQIFDMCRNWTGGLKGPPITMSWPPKELSTIGYRSNAPPATKTLDLADLPCPPSNVAEIYDSRVPYYPILRNPFANSREELGDCKVAAIRDPPVYATRVGQISGRKGGGGRIS